jgi:hypothetical protein
MVMTFTCNCRLHRRARWFALRPAVLLIVVKVLLIKSPKQRLETHFRDLAAILKMADISKILKTLGPTRIIYL